MKTTVYLLAFISFLFTATSSVHAESSETTRELNGTAITYLYTSGRSYNVKFEESGLSYRYLTGSKPEVWWGPFPYQAIRIEEGLFFASWFEKEYGDYVTLLLNFKERKLHGSAILRGEEVHFHSAKIIKIEGR